MPASPPASYLTLSLRNLGFVRPHSITMRRWLLTTSEDRFSTINTNLLTIPSKVGSMITMTAITIVSEQLNDRSFVSMSEDFWLLPFLVALRTLPENPNPWVFYVSRHIIPPF